MTTEPLAIGSLSAPENFHVSFDVADTRDTSLLLRENGVWCLAATLLDVWGAPRNFSFFNHIDQRGAVGSRRHQAQYFAIFRDVWQRKILPGSQGGHGSLSKKRATLSIAAIYEADGELAKMLVETVLLAEPQRRLSAKELCQMLREMERRDVAKFTKAFDEALNRLSSTRGRDTRIETGLLSAYNNLATHTPLLLEAPLSLSRSNPQADGRFESPLRRSKQVDGRWANPNPFVSMDEGDGRI